MCNSERLVDDLDHQRHECERLASELTEAEARAEVAAQRIKQLEKGYDELNAYASRWKARAEAAAGERDKAVDAAIALNNTAVAELEAERERAEAAERQIIGLQREVQRQWDRWTERLDVHQEAVRRARTADVRAEALVVALEFYANEENYEQGAAPSAVDFDNGRKARKALAAAQVQEPDYDFERDRLESEFDERATLAADQEAQEQPQEEGK